MATLRPMLAAQKYQSAGDLWTPKHEAVVRAHLEEDGYLIVEPKWDGFRMLHYNDIPMSRSGKPLANQALQRFVEDTPELAGIDCEVFPGHNYHPEAFRQGMSEIRSGDGSGNIMLVVYDDISEPNVPYATRMFNAMAKIGDTEKRFVCADGHYKVLIRECPSVNVTTLEQLYDEEARLVALNFEGAIVRRPNKAYKFGRATALGGELVKVKRRQTYDAVVEGYEEGTENQNQATQNELGYQVRSSHKANLVPNGRLGALHIKFVNGPFKGVSQKVGVFRGLTHGDLATLWNERDTLEGRYCELSVDSASGGYDAARCPVWLRWRPREEF